MEDDQSWREEDFRAKIVAKFDERIERMETAPGRSARQLEERVFEKSNSKDEYLRFASRILISLKD